METYRPLQWVTYSTVHTMCYVSLVCHSPRQSTANTWEASLYLCRANEAELTPDGECLSVSTFSSSPLRFMLHIVRSESGLNITVSLSEDRIWGDKQFLHLDTRGIFLSTAGSIYCFPFFTAFFPTGWWSVFAFSPSSQLHHLYFRFRQLKHTEMALHT